MAEKPTFVIGDVHGNLDRLEALLRQEGIIGDCPLCGGSGDSSNPTRDLKVVRGPGMCRRCDGDGVTRINHDVTVVQLGDLGHFGVDGSPTGDTMAYHYGDKWLDIVLWGNHDFAVVGGPTFRGYQTNYEAKHIMQNLAHEDRLRFAYAAHGWLITHAGLHSAWKHQKDISFNRDDPEKFAHWINSYNPSGGTNNPEKHAIVNAISYTRNGPDQFGGILWRDFNESLYRGFPQIFGHTADLKKHRVRKDPKAAHSYCIDIGGKPGKDLLSNDCLGGIWLPEEKTVTWRKHD